MSSCALHQKNQAGTPCCRKQIFLIFKSREVNPKLVKSKGQRHTVHMSSMEQVGTWSLDVISDRGGILVALAVFFMVPFPVMHISLLS